MWKVRQADVASLPGADPRVLTFPLASLSEQLGFWSSNMATRPAKKDIL